MKARGLFRIICIGFIACGAWSASLAAEFYPVPPPRIWGIDQKNVGSCQADAETTALEHSFSKVGYPMTLSNFYRHAKIIASRSERKPEDNLTQAEIDALNASPIQIVPEFMFPEDGRGRQNRNRERPSVSAFLAMDPEYQNRWGSIDYREYHYLFSTPRNGGKWGDPNTFVGSIDSLKAHIAERRAIVLDMHGPFLSRDIFDPSTGLLRKPYAREDFEKLLKEPFQKTTHGLAIVGFDDALYDGQGAFIARNTWAAPECRDACNDTKLDALKQEDLRKFRYKISKHNLPEYYAIPYAYVNDLINASPSDQSAADRGVGGYKFIYLDYKAFFDAYEAVAKNYDVYTLPYICDAESGHVKYRLEEIDEASNLLKNSRKAEEGRVRLLRVLSSDLQAVSRGDKLSDSPFSVARISINRTTQGKNLLDRFLDGELNTYYCDREVKASRRISLFPSRIDEKSEYLKEYLASATQRSASLAMIKEAYTILGCRHFDKGCKK